MGIDQHTTKAEFEAMPAVCLARFKEVPPAAFGGYDDVSAGLFTGDYVLFLIRDPSQWTSDILARKTDLSEAERMIELLLEQEA